jgi:hypothetical protein
MYLNKKYIALSVFLGILVSSHSAFAGDITGRVGIIMRSGDVKYAAKVDVLLATRAVPLSHPGKEDGYSNKFDYQRAVLNSLVGAWNEVVAQTRTNDYIKQRVKTDFEGRFAFANISPGKYFVVVTFPTQIAGYTVFWQGSCWIPGSWLCRCGVPRKAGHFIASMTYRHGRLSLAGPG